MNEAIEPRVTVGEYDEAGCWHPRWMDEDGVWHDGWGWWDEAGEWRVEQGCYDASGAWFSACTEEEGEGGREGKAEAEAEVLTVVGRFDREPARFVGISAAAHGLLLILAMTMPDSAQALNLEQHNMDDRFVQMALTEMQKEEPPEAPGWGEESQPEEEAAKHAGAEGEAGDPDETSTNKRLAVRGPDSPLVRSFDRLVCRRVPVPVLQGVSGFRSVSGAFSSDRNAPARSTPFDTCHCLGRGLPPDAWRAAHLSRR